MPGSGGPTCPAQIHEDTGTQPLEQTHGSAPTNKKGVVGPALLGNERALPAWCRLVSGPTALVARPCPLLGQAPGRIPFRVSRFLNLCGSEFKVSYHRGAEYAAPAEAKHKA